MPLDSRRYQFSLRSLLFWLTLLATAFGTGTCVFRAFQVPADPGSRPVDSVAFCPSGNQFVTSSDDGSVRLWDAQTAKEIHCYCRKAPVGNVAVSQDGRFVASAWDDWTNNQFGVMVWDLSKGFRVQTLVGHSEVVNSVAFTPDSRRIISASSDRTIRVWDLGTGKESSCLTGHEADINAVRVSLDGQFILSAGGDYWGGVLNDPSVRLWSLKDGSQVRVFRGHTGAVYDIDFTPDGTLAASASWDGTIRIWDVSTGQELRSFGESQFNAVAIHPNGRLLVSGSGVLSSPGAVILWDLTTGEKVRTFPCDTVAHDVGFSPDGSKIVSAHGVHTGRPARGFSFSGSESYVKDGGAILWETDGGKEKLRVADLPAEGSAKKRP
jgi:WD40 repeat protein